MDLAFQILYRFSEPLGNALERILVHEGAEPDEGVVQLQDSKSVTQRGVAITYPLLAVPSGAL